MKNVEMTTDVKSIDTLLDERNEYMRLYEELGNEDFKEMADQIILSLKRGTISNVPN